VGDSHEILREVMLRTGTSQSELARLSGAQQPSISQMLSGRRDPSDQMLERLLSCMGYSLEVIRRPVPVTLPRSVRRSWLLHRALARRLTPDALAEWTPRIHENLARLGGRVQGEPHTRNLLRWRRLVDGAEIEELRRVLIGLDTTAIEMREVSPMAGLLDEAARHEALGMRA
jgi:transcriptional regulator with XRE-family HTH domain